MKVSIVLTVVCLGLSACALAPTESDADRAARIERNRINAIKQAGMEASEKFGTAKAEFDKFHDQPDLVEMTEGNIIYSYRNSTPPMIYTFKNDKLISATVDKEALAKHDSDERRQDELQRAKAERDSERQRQALRSFHAPQVHLQGAQDRQTTNCVSTKVGDEVQTRCN